MLKKILPCLLAAVLMVACGGNDAADEEEHLLQPYEQALDRARAAEQDAKDAVERQRRAIEGEEDP
jgi:hypothetical protein